MILLFLLSIANAYEVNIYDYDKKHSIVEIIDNCNKKNQLLIEKKDLNKEKVELWLKELLKTNKCID